jgi:preprotein translocase subunit SecB
MRAHLQLDDYWVDALDVRDAAYPGSGESVSTALPDIDYEILKAPEDIAQGRECYLVKLKLSAGKAKVRLGIPYEFRVQLSGVFSFLPTTEASAKSTYLYYNAPAMLYGIARGMIGEITGTSRQRRYILPSVNFQEVYKRWKQKRDRQMVKQKAKPA